MASLPRQILARQHQNSQNVVDLVQSFSFLQSHIQRHSWTSSRIGKRGYSQGGSVLETSAAESDSTVGGPVCSHSMFRSVSVASTVADDQVPGTSQDSILQSTPVTVIKKPCAKVTTLIPTEQSVDTTNTSIQNLVTTFSSHAQQMQQTQSASPPVAQPRDMDMRSYLFTYLDMYTKKSTDPELWFEFQQQLFNLVGRFIRHSQDLKKPPEQQQQPDQQYQPTYTQGPTPVYQQQVRPQVYQQ